MTGSTGNPQADLHQRILDWVVDDVRHHDGLPILMISGAQGIGKSTALHALASLAAPRIAVIGLDDVYHTQQTRMALAREIHPLCQTRGPPGTHDLSLLKETIERLKQARATTSTRIPRFDKRADDRLARSGWQAFEGRPDLLIIEGWMMGVVSDPAAPASPALNDLEAKEDPDGTWRAWQEHHLGSDYAGLWNLADAMLHLDAPSFEVVLGWRQQQEETTLGLPRGALPPARATWVARFIQHYERLTLRMLSGGRRPGMVLKLDSDRRLLEPVAD